MSTTISSANDTRKMDQPMAGVLREALQTQLTILGVAMARLDTIEHGGTEDDYQRLQDALGQMQRLAVKINEGFADHRVACALLDRIQAARS